MTRRGTAMSRWKVRKFRNDFFSPGRCEWVAWPDGGWAECLGFPTHAEALAYADRRARTREVVLPRSNSTQKRAGYQWHIKEVESGAHLTRAKRTKDGYRMTQEAHIGRKDLVEVAMLLLAHAERMSQ